jgi:hypothetical protein
MRPVEIDAFDPGVQGHDLEKRLERVLIDHPLRIYIFRAETMALNQSQF